MTAGHFDPEDVLRLIAGLLDADIVEMDGDHVLQLNGWLANIAHLVVLNDSEPPHRVTQQFALAVYEEYDVDVEGNR